MTRRRVVAGLALSIVGALAGIAVLIVRVASEPPTPERDVDVALVLGAAVWGDAPSPVFAARLDAALDLYRAGHVEALVLTGGTRSDTVAAESAVARRYALAAGVPDAAIRVEGRSRTTAQNLACSRPLLEAAETVALVSDPLHLWRARWIARDLGLDVTVAPTPYTRYRSLGPRVRFLMREVGFAVVYGAERMNGPPRCPESGRASRP